MEIIGITFGIQDLNKLSRTNVSMVVDLDHTRGETSLSADDSDSTNEPKTTNISYIKRQIFTLPNQNLFAIESMITKTELIRILHLCNSHCKKKSLLQKEKRKVFKVSV